MKKSVAAAVIAGLLAGSLSGAEPRTKRWELHEAPKKMDWAAGVKYCQEIHERARLINLPEIQSAFDRRERMVAEGGEDTLLFVDDSYWTLDEYDDVGAYSFNFRNGIAYPDHKGSIFRVVCIKK